MTDYKLIDMRMDDKGDGDIIEPTSEERCIKNTDRECSHGFSEEECLGHYKSFCIKMLVAVGRLKPVEREVETIESK